MKNSRFVRINKHGRKYKKKKKDYCDSKNILRTEKVKNA